MPLVSELPHGEIGLYKLGRFYSLSFSGFPYESDLIRPRGVGREDYKTVQFGTARGGLQKTMRLIVLLHETSHFVHDLSLGAYLATDSALDQSSGLLFAALQLMGRTGATIHAPLFGRDVSNAVSGDTGTLLSLIGYLEDFVKHMWEHPPGLVSYCQNSLPFFEHVADLLPELSGVSLMEGLVATKTLIALSDRISGIQDAEYLHRSKFDLQILPEQLSATYRVAREIFDRTVGELIAPNCPQTEDVWPLGYSTSLRFLRDIGFLYLADIALHVPPAEFSNSQIERGLNTAEDFNPTFRFCKALVAILRNGGFPPDDPSEDASEYYIRVFDTIAQDPAHKWPTFADTNQLWKEFLAELKMTRGEAAEGYRFRMICERERRPHWTVMGDALLACSRQGIPIFHLTPAGFKAIKILFDGHNWMCVPGEWPHLPVWDMFQTMRPLWKDIPPNQDIRTARDEIGNELLFTQEMIYRSICTQLRSSLLYGDSFSCPFWPGSCKPGIPGCAGVKSFSDAPSDSCCARIHLAQSRLLDANVIWSGKAVEESVIQTPDDLQVAMRTLLKEAREQCPSCGSSVSRLTAFVEADRTIEFICKKCALERGAGRTLAVERSFPDV